jgi:hypothetical protein
MAAGVDRDIESYREPIQVVAGAVSLGVIGSELTIMRFFAVSA